jgi:hypothetical protein
MNARRYFTIVICTGLAVPGALCAQGGNGSGAAQANQPAPYTATRKITTEQTLPNGTTVTREAIEKTARDSAGRTYSAMRETVLAGTNQAPNYVSVNVIDPTTDTYTRWTSYSKEAVVVHTTDAGNPNRGHGSSAALPHLENQAHFIHSPRQSSDMQTEDLGTQPIVGVVARGTRITRVIPADGVDNVPPLKVVEVHWYSPELRIYLLETFDNPISGVTTNEVTELERGEPDASLFQVPVGYAVIEQYPNTAID